ncbi:MAG: hypothetical protein AAF512_19445 [Pseudomonadota bacterium]
MPPIRAKIPKTYQRILFSALALSWCSGVCFFVLSTWFMVEGEFGPEKHPWQYPSLMVHGGAAFLMIFCYGALLASHVTSAWPLKRSRITGLSIAIAVGLQIITAYLLYYLASESLRVWTVNVHLTVGFCLPLLLVFHLVAGKRGK